MKKQAQLKSWPKAIFILLFAVGIFSCEKQEYIQKFDDVFDVSGVESLNQEISRSVTIEDLSGVLGQVTLQVPQELQDVSLDEMIDHYTKSIKLTSKEIDLLLKNDSKTYLDVVNRFGSLPPKIAALNIDYKEIKTGPLNKFMVKQKAQTENFYSDDYYSAVLAYQNYIQNNVIEPISMLKKAAVTVPPGNPGSGPNGVITGYKLITSNNNRDMWWTYWSDGKRTKHVGASGSFPGV